MALSIFLEKNFSRILNDLNGYGHVFVDHIGERWWYRLVYDNTDVDVFYCSDLARKFYTSIDTSSIDLDQNQFMINLESGDFLIIVKRIQEVTQLPTPHNTSHPWPSSITYLLWVYGVQS